jgi:hypothetical protein
VPDKAGQSEFLTHGWTLANAGHPLGSLQGRPTDSYQMVVLVGPKNRFGASYFKIFLNSASGELSRQPAVTGLYNKGSHPGYNWVEIISLSPAGSSGEATLEMTPGGLAHQILQGLADLIPPGGHMMVEYDSPGQQETARSLALGIPPVATPLGYLMFLVGCGVAFRDWYFAEGGSEGPRKLQGYKALDSRHAELKAREMERELNAFLRSPGGGSELEKAARNRAHVILSKLKGI